jgi:hypothetical protein
VSVPEAIEIRDGQIYRWRSAPVPCHNSHTGSELVFLCSSGCSSVLVDQAVDDLPALDPGGHIDRLAGLVQRRSLFPRLVRPMFVVMPRVLGQDPPEVSFTVDQEAVKALAPQRSHIPLREGVRAGRPDRRLDDPHTIAGEHLIEYRRELPVTIAGQEFEPGSTFAEVHEQVAGLLDGPRSVGCAVTPRMCTRRVWISITKKTYRRFRNTVSTCKKSHARIPDAGEARNCRQAGDA